jgi:probable DNA metabolism protein
MYGVRIADDADEADFRAIARQGIANDLAPEQLAFISPDEPVLFAPPPDEGASSAPFSVPRAYAELLHDAICHRSADRFALLYDVLWRIRHGAHALADNAADHAVAHLNDYARAVRRDIHKMHAFLRFRPRHVNGHMAYVAWFEPQHFVLRRAVPFFVDRFSQMEWLIATPLGTAAWSDGTLSFGPPAQKPESEDDPVLDDLWATYYRTTFNPARMRLKAMVNEMPRHYWANMPETAQIPTMIAGAESRVARMNKTAPDLPPRFASAVTNSVARPIEHAETQLAQLRAAVHACRRCPLYGPATRSVFGEGPPNAQTIFVGEQPGDQEDLTGRPFVGPAGQLFERALAEAGIGRETVYVTNAVKHFKFEARGKRRIHKKPNAGEVEACRWWLDQEIAVVKPRLVVALGGTAASALAHRPVSVLRERGLTAFGSLRGFVTVHPSFLLRLPDEAAAATEYQRFVTDLRGVKALMSDLHNFGPRA